MAINRADRVLTADAQDAKMRQRSLPKPVAFLSISRGLFLLIVTMGLLVTSCISVRPVVKIGLLASFEGLHRRNGYEALAAMRLAINRVATQGDSLHAVTVIPLALDAGTTAAQARRSAQKLLADPDVKAIIGPYDPAAIEAVRPIIEATQLPWYSPFTLDPAAGIVPVTTSPKWATALVRAVATAAKAQGQQRLLLLGPAAGWPPLADLAKTEAALPVVAVDPPLAVEEDSGIRATDALFWLGSPERSAVTIEALRLYQPNVPFWLGPWGSDLVWAERTANHGNMYWISWVDDGYHRWADEMSTQGSLHSPIAYLTYRATEAALRTIEPVSVLPVPTWRSQLFALQDDGSSRPLDSLQP